MTMDRRDFLKHTALASAAFAFPWSRQAQAATGNDNVLVTIFLRGAADGLSLVTPVRNRQRYYALRPNIAVPESDLLGLGNGFALHPALAPIRGLYNQGKLGIVHAVGSPHPSRSHFEAQDYMERANPGTVNGAGWMNNMLQVLGATDQLSGVALRSSQLAVSEGAAPQLVMTSVDGFKLRGGRAAARQQALEKQYGGLGGLLARSVKQAFETTSRVGTIDTSTSVTYPGSPLGTGLKDAAALIRSGLPVRALALDMGGWDHHDSHPGRMQGTAGGLAGALRAFWDDLAGHRNRTTVVVMTEFGRTAAENGSLGLDHGHGSVMFVLGGNVNGGKVHVDSWPGLGANQLYEGRDLAVTCDFRRVLSEIIEKHMGLNPGQQAPIFPGGYTVRRGDYLGIM